MARALRIFSELSTIQDLSKQYTSNQLRTMEFAIGGVTLSPNRPLAPQLVDEVDEENNVVLRELRFWRLGRHEYDDTLAVRGEIVVRPIEAGVHRDSSNERHRGTFLKLRHCCALDTRFCLCSTPSDAAGGHIGHD
jgi:hypothetical protein